VADGSIVNTETVRSERTYTARAAEILQVVLTLNTFRPHFGEARREDHRALGSAFGGRLDAGGDGVGRDGDNDQVDVFG
jgi:hypothetical protein